MKLSQEQSKLYHSKTLRNKRQIENSVQCGCLSCCRIYPSHEIVESFKDGEEYTVLCPYCGTDAVIGSASGLEINYEILKVLNKIWF